MGGDLGNGSRGRQLAMYVRYSKLKRNGYTYMVGEVNGWSGCCD